MIAKHTVRFFQQIFSLLSFCSLMFLTTCKDVGNPVNDDKPPCPSIRIGAPSPYGEPVWHPSGQFIGFNYLPLVRITYPYGEHCQGQYEWNLDSSGYWLINPDGANLRRILPYFLEMVSWSPDGQWIAFGAGAQIFKMRFTETTFDTTTLVQLTTVGRNFLPAWSPDEQWIAYDRSLPDSSGPAGIWVMRYDGTMKHALFGGAFPAWHPNGNILLGVIGTSPTSIWKRFVRYDFLQSKPIDTLSAAVGGDNRSPRYSPDGTKIAFWSKLGDGSGNIWVMNSDGSNPQQLTTEGATDWLSWNPDGGRIAYVSHRYTDWTYSNGTIWVVNVETGEKQQLTFNHPRK